MLTCSALLCMSAALMQPVAVQAEHPDVEGDVHPGPAGAAGGPQGPGHHPPHARYPASLPALPLVNSVSITASELDPPLNELL